MKNKILTALLAAAIAITAWLYVVTVVSPNSDKHFYNIPLDDSGKLTLYERDLMVVGMNTNEVDVVVEGNRVDLNKLTNKDIDVSADFEGANIFVAGQHNVKVNVVVPDGVDIMSRTPDKIEVTVVDRGRKTVPVDVQYGDTKVDPMYMPDKEGSVLDVTEISIAGPKEAIDQITKARVFVDLTDRTETIDDVFQVVLCNDKNEEISTEYFDEYITSVHFYMPIDRVKEITLQPTIIPGGGATAENSQITWNPQTIWVSGDEESLAKLDTLYFGEIDLGTILEDTTITFPLVLDDDLVCVSGITEVSVDVKFPELSLRTMTIKNIAAENVPENLKVTFLTQALEIQVRGPKEKVAALDPETLQIKVDFTDTELGMVKRKAVLIIDDEEIGTVGSYTVSVNVVEK